jgi:hypothetical protein
MTSGSTVPQRERKIRAEGRRNQFSVNKLHFFSLIGKKLAYLRS